MFLTVSHFHPSLAFAERKSLPIEWSNIRVCTQVSSSALARLEVTNGMELNTIVKSFIVQATYYNLVKLTGLHFKDRHLVLPANIRLE
jgi:hypothetical protein